MSRIDITARKKNTGEWLISQGFCRSPHVTTFCEQSQNAKLQDFAYLLYMGITLSQENIQGFLQQVEYVIQFLTTMEITKRSTYFSSYDETSYQQFIEDLSNGRDVLQSLSQEKDLNTLKVDVM